MVGCIGVSLAYILIYVTMFVSNPFIYSFYFFLQVVDNWEGLKSVFKYIDRNGGATITIAEMKVRRVSIMVLRVKANILATISILLIVTWIYIVVTYLTTFSP